MKDLSNNQSDENKGLSSIEAKRALEKYGRNEIPEEKKDYFRKIIRWFISPIGIMLMTADVLTLIAKKTFDFYFILILILLNLFISLWHEHKADEAIKKLREDLRFKVRALRDGQWSWVASTELVVGDLLELQVGDIVPADIKIVQATNLSANEAVLTGESLPKEKQNGETLYSGSSLMTGQGRGIVTAIGTNTYFGKTLALIEKPDRRSFLENDILSIARFLIILSLASVVIITIFSIIRAVPLVDTIVLDLSLVIAGIPISLPTVMTLIINLGALHLARKKVIVRRLSSLADLANVTLLLTDKTGTLTANRISIERVITYRSQTEDELLYLAAIGLPRPAIGAIDRAILERSGEYRPAVAAEVRQYIPADSERKHTTTTLKQGDKIKVVSVGAPQVILQLSRTSNAERQIINTDIEKAAKQGFRAIAVALGEGATEEKDLQFLGLILLFDPLIDDASEAIKFLGSQGTSVKILTGDHQAIGEQITEKLGLFGKVVPRNAFDWNNLSDEKFQEIATFTEILPEDKYRLAVFANKKYVLAVAGDGINDLPAMRIANVSIAVHNAVNAVKGASDIVLLSNGVGVIKDAVIEARRIFMRLSTYALYRISESFRVIFSLLILGLIFTNFPLTAVQLIVLALLNDVPIITLAFNRTTIPSRPAKIHAKRRFIRGSLFGLVGLVNSLIVVFALSRWLQVDWETIQTIFFLKLTVSGHMLIYVAHTEKRWYKYLPSRSVIIATSLTQLLASIMALSGIFMHPISVGWVLLIWGWAFFWMQISELMKRIGKPPVRA